LAGGQAAAPAQAWVERLDGRIEAIPSKRVLTLRQGERLHVETPGGGGYGDPFERDPEAVRQDVHDRRITLGTAREHYGVVLDEAMLTVDWAATRSVRTAARQPRQH
jgi:N-methylhydantoinase B/oxoprolinase/acetone carboxylase alpha subunit